MQTGEKFGRLMVERFVWKTTKGKHYQCLCECGQRTIVRADSLISGHTKACGCLRKDQLITHGRCYTPEHKIWRDMKQRCYNPKEPAYKDYGARGITVCVRWHNSYLAFLEDMGSRPKGLTLERKDNDGNYEPSNCKWETRSENNRNKRTNHIIEYGGKKQCVTAWAEERGIKTQSLFNRLNRHGWSIERALTEKVNAR